MPPPSKRQKKSKGATKAKLAKKSDLEHWVNQVAIFTDLAYELKNPKGRSRSFEENKLILLATAAELRRQVDKYNNDPDVKPNEVKITWTEVEKAVASDFRVGWEHVHDLRKEFIESGGSDVVVWGEDSTRGGSSENFDKSAMEKISPNVLLALAKFIDGIHSEGKTVRNRMVRSWLSTEHKIKISRRAVASAGDATTWTLMDTVEAKEEDTQQL